MYRKIVWCYVFVLTLLDISLKTRLSAQGKSHGVTLHDSLIEGISFQEWGSEAGDSKRGAEGIWLQPPSLEFGRAALAEPHARRVTLTNLANTTIHLASVAGTTPDFHASFFESKTLAPQANTTFSVVYLGRHEGPASAHLYIHTSLGVFKYPVSAEGVASEWGVWPLVGVRVPLNATVEPLLTLYNPTAHPVQVTEVYSSGSWLGLSLAGGGTGAARAAWLVPAGASRALVRLRVTPVGPALQTAYIRVRTNGTGAPLVLAVQARAVPPGEHLAPLHLSLAPRGSGDPPDTFELEAGNSLGSSVTVEGAVWGATCGDAPPSPERPAPPPAHNGQNDKSTTNGKRSDGVYLSLETSRLEPHQPLRRVGRVTLDYGEMWAAAAGAAAAGVAAEGAARQAWCGGWLRVGRARARYSVRVLAGTLALHPPRLLFITADEKKALEEREIRVHNEFPVPLHITGLHYPPEVLEHFHHESATPLVLGAGEQARLGSLRLRGLQPGLLLDANVTVRTNLTHYTLPLHLYSGQLLLEWEWPAEHSSAEELRLGAVGTSTRTVVWARLRNPGPRPLCVVEAQADLPGVSVWLADGACVAPRHAARARLTVHAPARPAALRGRLRVRTEHALHETRLSLRALAGRLLVHPLHFGYAAPYVWASAALVLENSMSVGMRLVNVSRPEPEPAVWFVSEGGGAEWSGRSAAGRVLFAPERLCAPRCYTGLDLREPEGAAWAARGAGGLEADAALHAARFAQYAALAHTHVNISLHVHTDQVVQARAAGGAGWAWPRVAAGAGAAAGAAGPAPLGAATTLRLRARNPSALPLVLQPVLAPVDLRLTDAVESPHCKSEQCVWTHDAFALSEWRSTRGLAREWSPGEGGAPPRPATRPSPQVLPPLLLAPDAEVELKITFTPDVAAALTTYLYLRNNLTIIEGVQLWGRGAHPRFELAGRAAGSPAALVLELRDCAPQPLRRAVSVRNTGDVPLRLHDWRVAGRPCEARGFRLSPCAALALAPNESRALHLAFSPDYTLARVAARLTLRVEHSTAEFSLLAVAPAALLPRCHSALLRPPFDSTMRTTGTLLALAVFVLVLAAAAIDAERELRRSRPPRLSAPPLRAPLDLRALAAEPPAPAPPPPCLPPRPPARRRRTARRPPVPSDPQAERRAFERWRSNVLRSAEDEDSRSSEDAEPDRGPSGSSENAPAVSAETPTAAALEMTNDGYEADPETEERLVGSDEDLGSTATISTSSASSSSSSSSSSPVEEREPVDDDDVGGREKRSLSDTPVGADGDPLVEVTPKRRSPLRPEDAREGREERRRREGGDAARRERDRPRRDSDGAIVRPRPVGPKHHARREKSSKRRCERAPASPGPVGARASPAAAAGGLRWGASWSSVVARGGGAGPEPAPLPPIGSDVRRRPPPADNSLFYFNGEQSVVPRPDADFAWRASPPADAAPFVSPPNDPYLEECAGVSSGYGGVWGGAWGWGGAALRPPPGFPAQPARVYDPFSSLAAIWAPSAPLWSPGTDAPQRPERSPPKVPGAPLDRNSDN